MALKFGEATGGQSSAKADSYKFVDGEQKVRLFGDICARYLFWVPNPKGNPNELPVEALQFDRNKEAWDNSVSEPVKEVHPDLKPKWSYSALCMTPNGEIKAFNFKRTLFNQIKDAAETLGDPTDLDKGWWVVFKKSKTGPSPLNVEYSLQALKCQKETGPLTDEQKAKIAEHPTIEEVFPRQNEEQVRKNLQNILSSGSSEEVDEDAVEDATGGINIE